jgi:flagellar hook-associated protein 2
MATTPTSSSTPASVFTPPTLSGISTYASDFQSILTRAAAIAQLPVTALQNQVSDVLSKETQLSTLATAVTNLGASIFALGTLADNQALVATSSDSATVSVQATGATDPATYTISDITSVASAASETSQAGYANSTTTAVSSTGTVNLVVGATTLKLTLTTATNNLVGLRDAINKSGLGVTAIVLTTGTGANPNYLSVTANNTGATTLQVIDDPTVGGANGNLLTSSNQGSDAVFKLNNLSVDKPGNTVSDVIPGITFTIVKPTPTPTPPATAVNVTLTLASDPTQLSTALQDFATNYNAAVDAVNVQVGSAAGLLSGDFLVRQIQQTLQAVNTFQGTGAIQSLSSLGIQFGSDGKITFDSTTFNSLSASQVSSAFAFIGSTTAGFGGLSEQFSQLTDPTTGLIHAQQASYSATETRLESNISDLNARIAVQQASLTSRLQAADALQAELTAQQQELNGTIQSLNFSSFGTPASSSVG